MREIDQIIAVCDQIVDEGTRMIRELGDEDPDQEKASWAMFEALCERLSLQEVAALFPGVSTPSPRLLDYVHLHLVERAKWPDEPMWPNSSRWPVGEGLTFSRSDVGGPDSPQPSHVWSAGCGGHRPSRPIRPRASNAGCPPDITEVALEHSCAWVRQGLPVGCPGGVAGGLASNHARGCCCHANTSSTV